jgi:hypothetical protein
LNTRRQYLAVIMIRMITADFTPPRRTENADVPVAKTLPELFNQTGVAFFLF